MLNCTVPSAWLVCNRESRWREYPLLRTELLCAFVLARARSATATLLDALEGVAGVWPWWWGRRGVLVVAHSTLFSSMLGSDA
jgi:hypothetical protein